MLFYKFNNQRERRSFGGSFFIEIQYCTLPESTDIKVITSVESIKNWQNNSLYVNDENKFFEEYCSILNKGYYNNLKQGIIDIYGINYYTKTETENIKKKLKENKPEDSEALLNWLEDAEKFNGFYVLGI
ncbi:MAG: hypothetical protein E7564_06660 [Ruminococcaceae bacterium]|nr:hypothetical protein [Oscillospiraceae bacterium]